MTRFFLYLPILFQLVLVQAQTGKPQILAKSLDQAFGKVFNKDAPGGSVFIQQGDHILYQRSFGLADLRTKEPFSASTVANLGSISKTFVAYGILLLQKHGKLSVEDNLLKYFPDFTHPEIARKITIRHLMSHTSGLPDSRETERDSIYYLTADDAQNFQPLKATAALEFEPGSNWKYSNPAYNGLALIIEKLTGRKWQDFIREQIFKPAGMVNSKITDGAFPDAGVAHGYRLVGGQYEEYDYGEYPTFCAAGNGGIWSSIDELRKYAAAIQSCAFLDCATLESARQVWHPANWASPDPMLHTMVWFNHKGLRAYYGSTANYQVIEHTGDQGGFKAHLAWIPAKKITLIWITNNELFLTDMIQQSLLEAGYLD